MTLLIKWLTCCLYRKHNASKPCPHLPLRNRPSVINTNHQSTHIGDYLIEFEIAKGRYGIVYKVSKDTKVYSIKQMVKSNTKLSYINKEIESMILLSKNVHINIVHFHHNIEVPDSYSLVLEYCPGHELYEEIKQTCPFSNNKTRLVMKQLFSGVSHLHKLGIMHRDLKPENIIYYNINTSVKIIDFGLVSFFNINKDLPRKLSLVGTSYYMAPEVLNRRYTSSCDEWSLGVIFYILLCGFPPFNGIDNKEIIHSIKHGELEFTPQRIWINISSKVIHIIESLLNRDCIKRKKCYQCIEDDWFKDTNNDINIK